MAHPQSELYGADRMFLEAAGALVKGGAHVSVTLPERGELGAALEAMGVDLHLVPTPVVRKAAMTPSGFLALAGLAVTSAPRMWKLLGTVQPDVVYVSTVTAPLWTVMARLTGRHVVVHVHEAQVAAPALVRMVLMAPLLAAHRIIINSSATGAVTAQHFRSLRRKMVRIYNGISVPEDVRPAGLPARRPARLVTVGRLSAIKGTDVAVAAVAELSRRGREVELHLVGAVYEGYEWFEEHLRAEVARHQLGASVIFEGFRPDGWRAFPDCDIALVPSRNDSFGNTSVEAQLCGAPVIVTDRQGLPETVDGGRRGAVVPGEDPAAIADAVEDMLDHWDQTLERATMARSECLRLFSVDRFGTELRDAVLNRW